VEKIKEAASKIAVSQCQAINHIAIFLTTPSRAARL
jgi:hypothetical protein